MAKRTKINWPNFIALLCLLVTIVALYVAYLTLKTGANEDKQKEEISNLVTAVSKLSDIYETQLRTNRSLQNSLDSQSRQITELKNIYLVAWGQFQISKKSLALVIDDKTRSTNLDQNALLLGINRMSYSLNDLYAYINPPHDPTEPLGDEFDAKMGAIKIQAMTLTANSYAWSRQYEYNNLMTLINYIDVTHLLFLHFSHGYSAVDFIIEKDFLKLFHYWNYLDKNDFLSNKFFIKGLDSLIQVTSHDSDSVFNSGHYAH
jgi:hypothetical protein